MGRIKIRQEIEVYEIDGEETPPLAKKSIGVNAHWNRSNMVVLVVEGTQFTVVGDDLTTATENAMNSGGN